MEWKNKNSFVLTINIPFTELVKRTYKINDTLEEEALGFFHGVVRGERDRTQKEILSLKFNLENSEVEPIVLLERDQVVSLGIYGSPVFEDPEEFGNYLWDNFDINVELRNISNGNQ